MVFVRFAECNLRCTVASAGFDCDTEFESGREMSLEEIMEQAERVSEGNGPQWMLLTGGEPGLQVDVAFVDAAHSAGYKLAIETNGTAKLPDGIDWICVSPKSAEHTLRQKTANEVKYVRCYGQEIPQPSVTAEHYLISPAFEPDWTVKQETLQWCIDLVRRNPGWRLSLQVHKVLGIR
jgi:organic radical activating enzyme